MWYRYLVVVCLFGWGCVAPAPRLQLPAPKTGTCFISDVKTKSYVEDKLDDILIDGSSMRLKHWVFNRTSGGCKITGTVYVNAKNRMGGYVGWRKYAFVVIETHDNYHYRIVHPTVEAILKRHGL